MWLRRRRYDKTHCGGRSTLSAEQRLDAYLVARGFATGREKAKELIQNGEVTVNGAVIRKASFSVNADDTVLCDNTDRYVGRGGLKLEKAIIDSRLNVTDAIALDIGASTGGFTQCLLQNGAQKVYAVDVGHGQLHPSLCADARVINLEGTDIRNVQLAETIPHGSVDVITADVSFISLKQILPHALPFLRENGTLVLLIKPQFEAGKSDVGKNGIVRDRAVHIRVLRDLLAFFAAQRCSATWLSGSPIQGGAGRQRGNIEYLVVLTYGDVADKPIDIRRIVDETFVSFQ